MIYEFTCYNKDCSRYKQRVEVRVKASEIQTHREKCPECLRDLTRVFSNFAFRGFGEDKYKGT